MKLIRNLFITLIDALPYFRILISRRTYVHQEKTNKLAAIPLKGLTKSQKKHIKDYWGDIKIDSKWIEFYNFAHYGATDTIDVRFIPDDLWYCIIEPFFNNSSAAKYLDDKNNYDLLFYDIARPVTIARVMNGILLDSFYNTIDFNELVLLCQKSNSVIIKKSVDSDGGHGVSLWNKTKPITDLQEILSHGNNFIIQEVLEQHPTMSYLHESSINTIRIISLYWEGEVRILSSIVRMGINGNYVDNASSGGIYCGVTSNGCLKKYAYDVNGNKFTTHPQGAVFEGYVVPGYTECINIVKELAPRVVKYCKLPSWDFSIDKSGHPVFIEVNMTYGQIDFHQISNGPIFDNDTKQIVQYSISSFPVKIISKMFLK